MKKFEKTALEAIRLRAGATGDDYMMIEDIALDLGGPADFDDVLAGLHGKGMITLHRQADALSLCERGRVALLKP